MRLNHIERNNNKKVSLHPTQQGTLCQQEILIMHSPCFIFLYVPKINFILLDRIDELTSGIKVKVHKKKSQSSQMP